MIIHDSSFEFASRTFESVCRWLLDLLEPTQAK